MKIISRIHKSYSRVICFIFACLLLIFIVACGASRGGGDLGEEEINLDDLLKEEEQMSAKDRESEEAEVLRLLGITPEEDKSGASQISTVVGQQQPSSTPNEVTQLQQEIEEKDREISQLRSNLVQKETKISELQSQVQALERSGRAYSGTSKGLAPASDFKSRYQYALEQFNSRNYQGAMSIFSELLSIDSNNSLSDNCQYWIGECHYGLGNYNQAIAEFERVFSFPNSNKSDDAQLKLGICYLKLGDRQQARAEFERLLSNYPDSEYIELAQRYLTRL